MNIDYKAIGGRIKEQRKKNAMTQERVAELLDVTIGYISQVERGITKPNIELLGKLASLFNCDISYFVSGVTYDSDDYLYEDMKKKYQKLNNRDKRIIISIMDDMLTIYEIGKLQ